MKKTYVLIVAFSLAILTVVSSIDSADALQSVKEDSTKTTVYLNENVTFTAEVTPSAHIQWILDGVTAQSEYTSNSKYVFLPKAAGTYMVGLSVDGFTDPMGPKKVTVLSLPIPSPTVKPNPTSTPSVPEFSWLTVLPLLLSIPIVLIISKKRLQTKLRQKNKSHPLLKCTEFVHCFRCFAKQFTTFGKLGS